MKKYILIVVIFILLALAIIAIQQNSYQPTAGLKIAVTIFPLKDITQNVVKEKADVVQLIPVGTDPHSFDPTPETLKQLSDADIVFYIGAGLDNWIAGKAKEINPGITIIDLSEYVTDVLKYADGAIDPHYWLSTFNAKQIAQTIGKEISKIDAANATLYIDNAALYGRQMNNLRFLNYRKIQDLGPTVEIITQHDGYRYLAKDLSFTVIAALEHSEGVEISASKITEITNLIKQKNLKTIYGEISSSNSTINAIAEDTGIKLVGLNPIGGTEYTKTYIDLINFNTDQIVSGFK